MAYPTVDAPYGLKPVKLLSGVPYVGTTRQYSIASGYATTFSTETLLSSLPEAPLNVIRLMLP
jgi:hypothetical protein